MVEGFWVSGIAKHIAASGYGVYAIDHPGFGLSEGLHGYVPSFDGIVDNVIEQFSLMKGARFVNINCLLLVGNVIMMHLHCNK